MKINRKELLAALIRVEAGLLDRPNDPASFWLANGMVMTCGDVVCTGDCPIKLPNGEWLAVAGEPFIALIQKLTSDEIDIERTEAGLMVTRGGRRSCLYAKEGAPPMEVPTPKKASWKKLPEEFGEALNLVQASAGKDPSTPFICVHFTPKFMEASDDFQITRWRIKLPLDLPVLLPRDGVKHAAGMEEVAVGPSWVHFRASNYDLACPRYDGEYHDTAPMLSGNKGELITLPPGIVEAADLASYFADDDDDGMVLVTLSEKSSIRGEGPHGWHKEPLKVAWKDTPVKFMIAPKTLMEIAKKHTEVRIGNNTIRVDGEKWCFVSCLSVVENEE